MVNRNRNNAKSRRRTRRGGDLPVIQDTNVIQNPPSTTEVIIEKQNPPLNNNAENESWTSGITSDITSGFNKLTDGAKNLVKTEEGEEE